MEVRDVRWDDFEGITEYYYELYDEVKENPDLGILLLPERPTLGEEALWFARLLREMEEGSRIAAVAVEDGKAIGLCEVHRKGPMVEVQHLGELGLVVARSYRGRGAGKALLQYVLAKCRGKFSIVVLSVFVSNVRARRLYRSVGFRPWGVLPKAIRRDGRYTDEEHMAIELPPSPDSPS